MTNGVDDLKEFLGREVEAIHGLLRRPCLHIYLNGPEGVLHVTREPSLCCALRVVGLVRTCGGVVANGVREVGQGG